MLSCMIMNLTIIIASISMGLVVLGKLLFTSLCHILKSNGKKICKMAFTGIAATLLPNGKTVHKTFL